MSGMKLTIISLVAACCLSACGSSGTQSNLPVEGYYWTWGKDGGYKAPTTSDQALSFQKLPGDDKTQVDEPANTGSAQSLVSGDLSLAGYSGGNITVAALEAQTCAEGYCALEGKVPLAAMNLTQVGYFSLVVPHSSQHVILKGSYQSADGVSYQGKVYLGVLGTRKDGVTLAINPQ